MDNNHHQPKLTCAEIAALWTQYMNETAGLCFNKYMLQHIEDTDIKSVFNYAITLGRNHLVRIKEFLIKDHFPVPIGFTDHDLTSNAPRLFTEIFSLHYLNVMSLHGCHGYSGAVTTSTRKDVREYFTDCIASAVELSNQTKDILLAKGLYHRPPVIHPSERTDFVQNENFLVGWFGEKRPLSCIEITDIYFNLKKSILAKAVTMAFSQVVKSKNIKDFLIDAIKIKEKHINLFSNVLTEENLPTVPLLDSEVTGSTTPPFSDKLMVFHIGFLFSTAMVYYGTGWSSSPRRDLSPKYMMAIADDLRIGNDWMQIMINNAWLEQPPLAEDRKELAKNNK